jgi:hypothetical protein
LASTSAAVWPPAHWFAPWAASFPGDPPIFDNADLIHAYTRADAVRDGALIDVSATARETGIHGPVALTAAAWAKCVAVPPGVACQDEAGRPLPFDPQEFGLR